MSLTIPVSASRRYRHPRLCPRRQQPGRAGQKPPVREVDIGVDRALLDAAPGVALKQTRAIAAQVAALADGQDFILDNISNTLAVARDDARRTRQAGTVGGLWVR